MDKVELGTIIAGAIVPVFISLLKRWVKLSKNLVSFITLAVCFLVASAFELYEDGFNWDTYLGRIIEVYGASQIIYWAVLKSLELDVRIEGDGK
jgi:hypothetical protein